VERMSTATLQSEAESLDSMPRSSQDQLKLTAQISHIQTQLTVANSHALHDD